MAKQIILAVRFPGVDHTTVWSDPASASDFAAFAHLARTAERGLFDLFLLTEEPRLRERGSRIHELDMAGRPDALTMLSALASVTTHLGLAGAVSATFNEPYEVARRVATLDHLSGGRAAWTIVTSSDALTGENFRRGGFLDGGPRYERAAEFVRAARTLWDSWPADAGAFVHRGPHFDIGGHFTVPRSPQGRPVIIHEDDSDEGRELSAATADVVLTRHAAPRAGQAFYRDVKSRLPGFGRSPEDLKVLPAVTFVLGDTEADARERADHVRRLQVSPQTAIALLERVWNRDLSGHDPDGPLPEEDPDPAGSHDDRLATARTWRAIAGERGLSTRELIIEVTERPSFVGTPARVAAQIDRLVQADAADGYVLVPHLVPGGLDTFVARVVPLLQERGVFRTEYTAGTLRGELGLGRVRDGVPA